MKRRTYLASATAAAASLAGCIGDSGSDENPDDGYPPESAVDAPDEREIDTSSFETLTVGESEVPLVPVDVAHYWYQRREARFVDARGEGQYENSHVTGAVLSTARRVDFWSQPRDGPTTDWPAEDRVVCYCGCPHHLSSLRAGEFLADGHEEAYAIDEGYGAWVDSDYPTAGAEANQSSYVIRGRTDPADAGGYAWASHADTDQQEAGPIADDGSFELTLHFAGVGPASVVDLRTPSYELSAPLSDLTGGVVTAP